MIKVGIIGGAGYTAGELIRLLLNHPDAEITFVNSTSNAGNKITDVHSGLYGETDLIFTDELPLDQIDLLFFCTAHGDTKKFMESHTVPENVKIIDLSMDYRIESPEHDFVYGLPELNRRRICNAQHIANPGCFATCIQLAVLPLAKHLMLNSDLHVNAITGSTGAGVKPSSTSHFSWRNDNISIYKPFTHQHLAEIGQKGNIKLQALHNGNDLLAKYKSNAPQEQKVSSEDWMKKILSSEDSGVGISGTNDPILDMAMTTFMSLMMLAAQIDSNDEERQKGLISAMAANRLVDLTSLVPGMRQCTITVGENGKTVLHAESGTVKIDRELTSSEMNRLSLILGNANLSEESKRTKIAGMVTGIVATQQASQNFEQGMEAESQQQNLQRK